MFIFMFVFILFRCKHSVKSKAALLTIMYLHRYTIYSSLCLIYICPCHIRYEYSIVQYSGPEGLASIIIVIIIPSVSYFRGGKGGGGGGVGVGVGVGGG